MNRNLLSLILAGMVFLCSSCGINIPNQLELATLIITNGTIIDGTGADPIPDGLVAVEDDRIIAVGPASDFRMPDAAVVIDADGGTILPGVINSHSHQDASAASRRIFFLLDGVTSVCDMMISIQMMSDLDEHGIQAGPSARGFKAGPILTPPGGYPGVIFGTYNNYEIEGEEQAELAVIDLFERGADYIKIALEPGIFGDPWPVLTAGEVRAVARTAHDHGLFLRAHVNNAALEIALEGGVDVIEHVPMPSFFFEDLESMFDAEGVFHIPTRLEGQLQRMAEQGIVLVPTLDVIIHDTYLEGGMEPEQRAVSEAVLTVVGYYHEIGGIVALGNDYGNSGVEPGMPLDEMALLQAAGLSPLEIITAATQNAAFVCGHADELGTIEVGKLADLIVVDGNPLADLSVMDFVSYVVKNGEIAFSPQQEENE